VLHCVSRPRHSDERQILLTLQRAILVRLPDLKKESIKIEKDKRKRCSLFAQHGGFLRNSALQSTKREGSTGRGGCARIHDCGRRRTALGGKLIHRSYQIHANVSFNWTVAAFPLRLKHRVLKGKTWLSICGCPADQRRPHRLQRRVFRLRWTK